MIKYVILYGYPIKNVIFSGVFRPFQDIFPKPPPSSYVTLRIPIPFQNKELDATKDNLKNFIVRWETHPNSPYVFDVEGNVIAPLGESYPNPRRPHGQDSLSSSRGEYGSQRQRDRHALIHGK